jgi:flagellar biosynthesis/type III secretory pathway chaperone
MSVSELPEDAMSASELPEDAASDRPTAELDDFQICVDALEEVLAAERDLYVSMLDLTTREELAIVSDDLKGLTDIVDEKQLLVDHLNALETERMTALVAIEVATGMDPQTVTLSQIAARLPIADGRRLLENGVALRTEARALEQANLRNERLLHGSRDLVDRWLHYLRQVLGSYVYSADGQVQAPSNARSLDRSA